MPISLSKPGKARPKTGLSLKKPGQQNLALNFSSDPAPEITEESKSIASAAMFTVNSPEFMRGWINGIYAARVMLFDIIYMARDKQSYASIERKFRELVEQYDQLAEMQRARLGNIDPETAERLRTYEQWKAERMNIVFDVNGNLSLKENTNDN